MAASLRRGRRAPDPGHPHRLPGRGGPRPAGTQARAPGGGRRPVLRRVQHAVRACGCGGSGCGQRGWQRGRRAPASRGPASARARLPPARAGSTASSPRGRRCWPPMTTCTSAGGRRVTTNAHGKGRITYVGTVPNEALARDILQWAAPGPGRLASADGVADRHRRHGPGRPPPPVRAQLVLDARQLQAAGRGNGRHQRRVPRLRRRAGAGRLGRAGAGGG